jgi:hypothetical protein
MKAISGGEWLTDFLAGFTAYYLTSLPVALGVWFGVNFLHPSRGAGAPDPVTACVQYDARHYVQIIQEGYSYDPAEPSMVAFFPAYPLLSRWAGWLFGLPPEEAALLTAHVALFGAFVLLARWVRLRWPEATAEQRGLVLAVFGLWPLGLFFRMPYAESLFVCATLAALYGMARDWPLIVLALLVGFVTAVRPVGVALAVAFAWHVLTRPGPSRLARGGRLLALGPLACWGLIAYMAYQWLAFGTPWAFVQTQQNWTLGLPEDTSWAKKLWSLATAEPIWDVYVPASPRYWANANVPGGPLSSILFWNPILFVLAAGLLVIAGWKGWLPGTELILGAALLGIPYLTRSYEMSMAGHGRFAAVVVVNYLVIGRLLTRSATLASTAVCTAFALLLCLFTSLYVANYPVF